MISCIETPTAHFENRFFQNTDNQHLLKLILQALAAKYPDVGYVQGMNFIAAHLLFHTRSVDATFELCDWMWSHPRFDARRLFAKGLEVLKRLTATLDMPWVPTSPVLAGTFASTKSDRYCTPRDGFSHTFRTHCPTSHSRYCGINSSKRDTTSFPARAVVFAKLPKQAPALRFWRGAYDSGDSSRRRPTTS